MNVSPTKNHTANRPEHQHQRDPPSDLGAGFMELFRQRRNSQRNREKVERIPAPREEGDKEKHPLLKI